MEEPWLVNDEAREYLILRRALEELKLEYRKLRIKNGNTNMPRVSREECDFRLVIISMEYIVEDAMWEWLETTPCVSVEFEEETEEIVPDPKLREPLGVVTDVIERPDGLYIYGSLNENGQAVINKIQDKEG